MKFSLHYTVFDEVVSIYSINFFSFFCHDYKTKQEIKKKLSFFTVFLPFLRVVLIVYFIFVGCCCIFQIRLTETLVGIYGTFTGKRYSSTEWNWRKTPHTKRQTYTFHTQTLTDTLKCLYKQKAIYMCSYCYICAQNSNRNDFFDCIAQLLELIDTEKK